VGEDGDPRALAGGQDRHSVRSIRSHVHRFGRDSDLLQFSPQPARRGFEFHNINNNIDCNHDINGNQNIDSNCNHGINNTN
jgi:hypothetical protein